MASDKDKRLFKRYKYKSAFSFSLKEKTLKGNLTDYSLKGIGFILNDTSDITSGSDVSFRVDDFNLKDKGRIVWSEKSDSYIKGGIERNTITGLLRHFPLTEILIDLQRSEKNGILDIRNASVIKRIYIKNGDMVTATSNQKEDRFAETLFGVGKITAYQYKRVIDVSNREMKNQGAVLVELGYLRPEDLTGAIKQQVEEIILSLFQWEDGIFNFREGHLLSDKVIHLKISAADLIYRGVRRITNIDHIRNAMPPPDTVLGYSADPMDLYQDINIRQTDKDILSLLDGKRTIQEIVSLTSLDESLTAKILYALLCTRIIIPIEKGFTHESMHDDILVEEKITIDPDFADKVEYLFNGLDSLDYYSFLEIDKRETSDKIKRAYYQAAKKFHPDKHLHLPSDIFKKKLNTIFAHLTEIYKILSNPERRIQYDKNLSVQQAPMHRSNTDLAKVRFQEGKEAFRKGTYAEAKDLFGQAVYLDSSVAEYYFNLGIALVKTDKFREAVNIFNQAIKLDPMNADYLAELGHVYLKLGLNLRAQSTFEKAIKMDPFHAMTYNGLKRIRDSSQ
jgi:hypothetical protein